MNILITGANGYLGSETVKGLGQDKRISSIIGTDITDTPRITGVENYTYYKSDVRDEKLVDILKNHKVDVVVHLATVVSPGPKADRDFLYSVDVLGTKNVVETSIAAGVKKIIATSSGAAYGYYDDNPEWLYEDDEIRGNYEFAYSYHKAEVERMLADYRKTNPDLEQLIFRPGTILGKTVNNQITDLFKKPFIMGITGSDSPFVFIWDRDVVGCILEGITTDKTGAYNLAGDGKLTMRELSTILKKPYVAIPNVILKTALAGLKMLKLTQYGPEQVNFLRYRPVLSNKNLKEKFKYIPQKTSRETFEFFLENRQS
jgi:UDP-glucose 4-epimerase